ncbi:hypothetical protein GCM10027446_01430 [Angustibacter peucedani]
MSGHVIAAVPTGICQLPGMKANPVCAAPDLVHGAVGQLAGGAVSSALRETAEAMIGAAKEVAGAVAAFLTTPGDLQLTQSWFQSSLGNILAACASYAALLFILGIGSAVLKSSAVELGRVVAHTVMAFAGSTVAVVVVQMFVLFTDATTAQLSAGTRTDITSLFSRLMEPLGPMPSASPGQAVLATLLGALIGLGMLAVYVELFVRSVMIHVVVFFVPLMLVGTIWAPTRGWAKRGAEFLGILVLSKFVLFAVIALGWSAIDSFRADELATSWSSVLTGVVLVAVAAWMPWLLFKMLPFMESHLRSAMTRREAQAGLTAPATAVATPLRTAQSQLQRAGRVALAVKTGGVSAAGAAGAGLGALGKPKAPPAMAGGAAAFPAPSAPPRVSGAPINTGAKGKPGDRS